MFVRGKTTLHDCADMIEQIRQYLHKPWYVDPEQLDAKGRTAAQLASKHRKRDVVAVLKVTGRKVEAQVFSNTMK